VVASDELKWYPSELALSIANDIDEPALPATREVISTSFQTLSAFGIKVVTSGPFAGRLL